MSFKINDYICKLVMALKNKLKLVIIKKQIQKLATLQDKKINLIAGGLDIYLIKLLINQHKYSFLVGPTCVNLHVPTSFGVLIWSHGHRYTDKKGGNMERVLNYKRKGPKDYSLELLKLQAE